MISSIIIVTLLLLQTCLNALSDSIIHHDPFINLGYFFSKDAAEARKKNWIHKYFPMFHDFWHLSKVLQTVCTMGVVYVATTSIVLIVILLILRGLLFNIVYR